MDNQLLEDLRRGDKNAIQGLYDSVFPVLKKHILKNSGQVEDAEDVFQESLVVVFRKSKKETFELTCALSTYIFAVGKNIWLDRLRRASRHQSVTINDSHVDEAQDVLELINENEKKLLFQKHFIKLMPDCQQILTLFLGGSSMKRIMETLDKFNKKRFLIFRGI